MKMLNINLKYFISSRIFYALIILISINKSFVDEYDKANNLIMNLLGNEKYINRKFNYLDENYSQKIIEFQESSQLEKILLRIIKHFNSYDTMHFIHNSKSGYTNEKNYVFFPLLSRFIEILENIFKNVSIFKNQLSLFLLVGLLISNLICFINGILFIRLCLLLGFNSEKIKIMILLYYINPGSIFNISIYSENFYFMIHLIFLTYMFINKDTDIAVRDQTKIKNLSFTNSLYNVITVSLFTIIITLSRSNAILMLIYFLIPLYSRLISIEYTESIRTNLIKIFQAFYHNKGLIIKFFFYCLQAYLCFNFITNYLPKNQICSSIVSDKRYFDNMAHNKSNNENEIYFRKKNLIENGNYWSEMCGFEIKISTERTNYNRKINETLHVSSEKIILNQKNITEIQSVYSILQQKHWDVRFLSQYSFAHLDRLILSFPMILISISLIYSIFKNIHFKRILEFKLNRILEIDAFVSDEKGDCCVGKGESEKENNKHEKDKEKSREIFLIFTFVNFLANFLIVFLIANIQIINRVSTSNPILYVYCSEFIIDFKKQKNPFGKFILIVFISYSVVGCIMHCASYGYA